MMAVPSRRASRAATFDEKNTHAWAPLPEREISSAAGTPSSRQDWMKAWASLAPIRVVEVHRKEMAGVVRQQRIHADGDAAGEVVVDRLVASAASAADGRSLRT